MKMSGTIIEIGEVFSKGNFRKQTFILNTLSGDNIEFTCINDKISLLDEFNINDNVTVSFNIKGNKWVSPDSTVKYFNTLNVISIESDDTLEDYRNIDTSGDGNDLPF